MTSALIISLYLFLLPNKVFPLVEVAYTWAIPMLLLVLIKPFERRLRFIVTIARVKKVFSSKNLEFNDLNREEHTEQHAIKSNFHLSKLISSS